MLRKAGGEPRKRFGQNFMIDGNLVRMVADAGEIRAGELVIEVGPGTGTLTEELLARGARVVAVEIDRDLAGLLRGRIVAGRGGVGGEGFRLIEGDVLAGKHELNEEVREVIEGELGRGGSVKLVANLPYNVASPLVVEMLMAGVGLLVFTVQREVAERLRAKAGEEAYGGLSVMAGMLARVEVLRVLPAGAFWPAPKVESALVRMVREDRLGVRARGFGEFVGKVFSYRRKTLRKALEMGGYDAGVLERVGMDGGRRAEEISAEDLWSLFEAGRKE